ncbi:MAG: ABC transporter permease [Pararhizobium sp.]
MTHLPLRRVVLICFTILVFVLIYLPIGLVVLMSFNKGAISSFPLSGFTLHWYRAMFSNAKTLDALWTSLIVAVPATTIATGIGLLAALVLVRHEFVGKRVFLVLTTLPMLAPGIILGVSLLIFARTVGLSTGYGAILCGHVLLAMPYCTFILMASLARFDRSLEEAARGLGASEARVFWRVTLPGITSGIFGSALFAFTISIGEFIVTFFLTSPGTTTLPIRIFSIVRVGITPEINAVSTLILAATLILAIGGISLGVVRRR